ncbi:alpha/beta hydrolase family protein [Paractinoplanes brasiliensis]|uniref:Platelet-activating factor acetylhydrolase isoform II n=1 Tax=Paractinoplanes brasiliensis TaxID=52695 RepID=A0A4V3C6C3_9ACTN|nr:carboxylic ester hydrolase [Actinoplanes brasiliensis]TDO33188.1 platelet-activating factor acetylhydrolase isoform II [Actinoplanes brasiliensis]GID33235.1 carboxylic ester hydrolase [Actinoplanes brasiliensis]
MRPFETALLAANAAALLVLAVTRLRRSLKWLPLIPILVAVAQLLVEGFRWQLAPAYVVTLALVSAWLPLQNAKRWFGRYRQTAVITRIAGLMSGTLIFLASVVLPAAVPVFHFAAPTGPYGIGTTIHHWVDPTRPEPFTTDPADHRELMAQLWYPAAPNPGAARAPYIADADAVAPALAAMTGLPSFLFSHFRYVTTNAVAGIPVAEATGEYPVLVFLSGLYGFRSVNTFQIEELVSHGYVVVGLDQPGVVATVRFPGGRQIRNLPFDVIDPLVDQSIEPQPATPVLDGTPWPAGLVPLFAQDVRFALDRLRDIDAADPHGVLTGHLDLARAGVFGVSLGGRVAAESCLCDARLKACLVMDDPAPADVVAAGPHEPTMFLTRDAETMRLERRRSGGWSEHDIAMTLGTMRAAYSKATAGAYYVEIPNLFHVNFTDLPYWLPASKQLGLTGPIGGHRGFAVVNAYTLAFFDQVLRDRSSPLLAGASPPPAGTTLQVRKPSR